MCIHTLLRVSDIRILDAAKGNLTNKKVQNCNFLYRFENNEAEHRRKGFLHLTKNSAPNHNILWSQFSPKKWDSSADARLVNLALSMKTDMVSPQFHIQFDNFFETRCWKNYIPKSEWQVKVDQKPPSETPNIDTSNMTKAIIEQRNY